MKTQILEEKDIDLVAKALQEGEVVCFATETVYGIGVIANQKEAFERLVAAKRRSPDKPRHRHSYFHPHGGTTCHARHWQRPAQPSPAAR